MRWRRAGADLARPNHVDQCAERPSMRSEPPPRCLSHAPDLACVQTCSSHPSQGRVHHRGRRRHQIPIALAAQPVPNFPRLRALALFGRRTAERAGSSSLPASENLHNTGNDKAYSITSSARPSSIGGTSRPIAFAALRLITSSNLVGCSTANSPGLAPLRILSTYTASRSNDALRLGP